MLIKRKSRYLSIDSDHLLTKKRENGRDKNLKYLSRNNSTIKRSTSHGQIKRLNSGVSSKYSLCQKDKVQFKIMVNQSNSDGNNDTSSVLTEKVKLKTIFNGKYFKNLYQKINHIQNNLREYVNNENQDLKSEQDHICNKLLNFGLKNSKSSTFNCPWSFSQLKKINLSEKSNLRNIIFNSNCKSDIKNLQSTNLSTTDSTIKPITLSPKISKVDTEKKSISVETKSISVETKSISDETKSEECSSEEVKTEISQTEKVLKEISLETQNQKESNDEPHNNNSDFENNANNKVNTNIVENHTDDSSSTCNSTEKINVLPETKFNTTESSSVMNSCNAKKSRRAKHTRSSAVCLSSNDIKGILSQSKKIDNSQSSKCESSTSNYILESSLNDSIKYEGNCRHEILLTNESLERKKLLSRNNYLPSLTTLNSTQFCYNDHYPTVSIPFFQRSSKVVHSWNNLRKY